ncbi:MAG: Holliday junction branch migration protein RuvA [Rhodospirillaceae bacterium]
MIAKLTGRLDSLGPDYAIVDVGGVGYLVFCATRTLTRFGTVGAAVSVMVETHVREDAITLYGFSEPSERDWFRLLITVQGVGARVALSLLGVLGPDDLVRTIAAQDKTALTRADGVGPKLATRILSELKDKAGGIALGPAATGGTALPATKIPDGGAPGDAVSALVNLGYGRTEAFAAVMAADRALGKGAGVSALIGQALKILGTAQ